jgi:hypothetical protein
VCSHKRTPCNRALPAWRDALFLEDASNRGPAHVIAEVLHGALNPRIAPGRVFGRHAHDQRPDVYVQTGTSSRATGVRPLAEDQLAMPSEDGVRRGDVATSRSPRRPRRCPIAARRHRS